MMDKTGKLPYSNKTNDGRAVPPHVEGQTTP
jgi:hypothetical protein